MKNKILSGIAIVIFTFAVVFSLFWVDASQSNAQEQPSLTSTIGLNATIQSNGANAGIGISKINGKEYLFLPANANLKKLILNFNAEKYTVEIFKDNKFQEITSGSEVNVTSFLAETAEDESRIARIRLTDNSGVISDYELHVMQSANIPAMFINSGDPTKGREYIESSKSNKTTGSMIMMTAQGNTVYNGGLSQIKGRGNTTFLADKKPYQIKLDSSVELVNGAGASKTWILLANAYDPTLVHNTLAFKISNSMGINTPGYKAVDLYYDGVYRGNYLLCEKVQVGKNRVEIYSLEDENENANPGKKLENNATAKAKNKYGDEIQYVTGVANPADISGGYLLELDNAYYKGERSYFILSDNTPFVIKSPENCSKEEVEFISDYMEEMLRAAGNGGIEPENGKSVWEYIDKNSLARYFVLQQITKNADAFISSTYFYLNNDGTPMLAGPTWDFDDSYGIREDVSLPEGIVGGLWVSAFVNLEDFRKSVKSYYSSNGYSYAVNAGISSMVSEIRASEKMNRVLWNNSKQMYSKLATYDEDIAYLKDFASQRAKWLKTEFNKW